MTEEQVIEIGQETIKTLLLLSGPILGVALVIGVVVSLLQAVTQINEATLSFIPKLIGILLVGMILAPWMMKVMEEFTIQMLGQGHEWIR